ncbi:hypothetical protein [Thermonema rossianum]|uniref:hypothetical protein n=1 Tax=Thermonema rossianum TaxID=55505 RepID=UPI0005708F9C|nr:hypothetical protein [Thermonema rossianum]
MKSILRAQKAAKVVEDLLSPYREGNHLYIQNLPLDDLLKLLAQIREQDEFIDKGRKGLNILLAVLIILLVGCVFLMAAVSVVAGIIGFVLLIALTVFYFVADSQLKRADVNNTLSQYVPELLERLRFDLAEEAPLALTAFVAERYSKEAFKKKTKRGRTRTKYYEISPSVQIDAVLADKSRLRAIIHEYPYEKTVTRVNYRGKVKTKTKYGLRFVHEVNLAIPTEMTLTASPVAGIKTKIKEGEKRDKVRLAKKEKHKTGTDKIALIHLAPSVDITMELLYRAYQMLKPGQAA